MRANCTHYMGVCDRLVCTRESHEALKRDRSVWASLQLIGYQETETDDGQPASLEMRNCSCGSTLCVDVSS